MMSKQILTWPFDGGAERKEGDYDRQQKQLCPGDKGFQWDGV